MRKKLDSMNVSWITVAVVCLLGISPLPAAELSVVNLGMNPDTTANVVVSGLITAEQTSGYTILLEIVNRTGNIGTITFTPAPTIDVIQAVDPWPSLGTFTPFDTDLTGSIRLNGCVDDNGAGGATTLLTFSSALAEFPVIASFDAAGVWDVLLTTSAGDSSWQGAVAPLPTTFIAGTITITTGECNLDTDCDDLIACTNDTCNTNICVFTPDDLNCVDDGLFCTGTEVCDPIFDCVSTGSPCLVSEFCNESTGTCDECQLATDCNDGIACTDQSCVLGSCVFTTNDANCANDGLFCNGSEVCDLAQDCISNGNPCLAGEVCDEASGLCLNCAVDVDCDDGNPCTDDVCNIDLCEYTNNSIACDDGFFCSLLDVCSGGVCGGSGDPCPGQVCDEFLNACIGAAASLTVESMDVNHGATANLLISGEIVGFDTFGVTIQIEIRSRGGNTGTLTFTPSPPSDIFQQGDAWPGVGTFTTFDSDISGTNSPLLNGSVDDNGEAFPSPLSYSGFLSAFPVIASGGAGGVWDILLSTSVGDSTWEGVVTTLNAGTVTVFPSVGLSIQSFALPPGVTQQLEVFGNVDNQLTSGVSVLLEITPRVGNTGMVTFTPSPPVDIVQLLDPWPGVGTYSAFDTDTSGSLLQNGSVDDNGIFQTSLLTYAGPLSGFPIITSIDADGIWDVTLSTRSGISSWQNLNAILIDGTITVTPGACLIDTDCNDGNVCSDDTCVLGVCNNINNSLACNDGDQCTSNDVCILGTCVGIPITEGGACDDGDLCTIADACNGGACAGTPTDCSGLDDACNVGTCNVTTGVCEAVNINEGITCDDGSLCTDFDVCTAGVCAGLSLDCSSFDSECFVGVCNGATGLCEESQLADGTFCDDADLCTFSDNCSAGICAGTALDCSSLDDGCIVGSCNGTTGLCEAVAVNEGDPCNDTDLCTVNDVCVGGVCGGSPRDCSSLDSTCSLGICNASTGRCDRSNINDGLACDDGFVCTNNDICSSGFCTGTLVGTAGVDISLSPVTPTVQVGNILEIEIIAASSTCADQPTASVEAIIAWDPAFLQLVGKTDINIDVWNESEFPDDSKLDGLNAPFGLVPGNDGDAFYLAFAGFTLNEAAFLPETGMVVTTLEFMALDGIVNTPIVLPSTAGFFTNTRVLGAGVNAGQVITNAVSSTSVQVVECSINSDCDDGNICTTDVCTNGICSNTNNTVSCDDGIFCTATDVCSGGVCSGSGDPCPGQLCNETLDACVECFVDNDCLDGDVCTTDSCNALGACIHDNNTAVCNDNLFCTAADQCGGGLCIGTGDRCPGQLCDEPNNRCVQCLGDGDCNDGNLCTDDTCNLALGLCVQTPNVLPCDDGLFCSTTDVCSNGTCVGTGDPCPGQLCNDILNQCVECITNLDCDDGNPCTTDICNVDTCNIFDNTNACEDGLFCTEGDTCQSGVCIPGGDACPGQFCHEFGNTCLDCLVDTDCNDNIGCTIDTCDTRFGTCDFAPDHAVCDDNTFCNGAETCSAVTGCVASVNPCDAPSLCDEVTDICGCQTPIVISEGGRYISVTPLSGSTPVSILVVGDPFDFEVSCLSQYVQPDGSLDVTPFYQSPAAWGTIHIGDTAIRPSTVYQVVTDCRDLPTDPQNLSTVTLTTTWRWGDVNNDLRADIVDVLFIVDGWLGVFNSVTLYNLDLAECLPNRIIDIADVLNGVDAFLGTGFLCPATCP